MKIFKALLGAGMICAVMATTTAQADTFVWQDPDQDFIMSFPDVWRLQTKDVPNTALRIAGPIAEDLATCRMEVSDDGRVDIYTKPVLDIAVSQKLTEDFWQGQIARYDDAKIAAYFSPASLGDKGDATAVKYVFNENKVPMYGVSIASIYGGKRYVASCASKSDIYDRYATLFASIIDSVQLKSKYHPFPTGYYRDFLSDPRLVLPRVKPGTIEPGGNMWFHPDYTYNK